MSGKTALLLVDCQEDYLARDGLQPPRDALVANIADALNTARAKGWPIFHVRTRVAVDRSDAMPHRHGTPEVVEGTPGTQAPAELREEDGELLFFKRFFSAFDAAGLEDALHSSGVDALVIAGVHSHACVQATVLDAYARGFDVAIGDDLVGSYDPAHAAQALAWLDGRAAVVRSSAAILGRAIEAWRHYDPCNSDELLFEVEPNDPDSVREAARRLRNHETMPIAERSAALRKWHARLAADREVWLEALVRDLGKPRRDAEGEVAYGLDLLEHVASTLGDEETDGSRRVRYQPAGVAGLITPWNNPFAIPIAKLAPALGYGNPALWKPALPGTRIAEMLRDSLAQSGLGDRVAMVAGDGAVGRAVLANSDLVSFTGSVAIGRTIVAEAGRRGIPVQAELGGSNAAIVDSTADLDAAARDLAGAIFSFAGQRCTAIRRVLVVDTVYDAFVDRLVAAVEALRVGDPGQAATQVGPVLDKSRQRAFLAMASETAVLTGGEAPHGLPAAGCWLAPTLMAGPPSGHALMKSEVFGPVAALVRVPDMAAGIAVHNSTDMGLLGAVFTDSEESKAQFLAEAQAGILSINRARPSFSAAGPFTGWKASSYGSPEHGRWNRDFHTRTQAVYGD